MAVINELGGEKIDIIEYSDDPEQYIANAMSPAKVLEIKILPRNKALVIVSEDQLSLAIGKEGQNVRLAAKLTGWKIDVRSAEQVEQELKLWNGLNQYRRYDDLANEVLIKQLMKSDINFNRCIYIHLIL